MQLNSPNLWQDQWPQTDAEGHKYTRGYVLVFGGELTGAARLSAEAVARIGAGIVSLIVPEESYIIYATTSPAHIIVRKYSSLQEANEQIERDTIRAIVIGPGFGKKEVLKELVLKVLARKVPCVIDADALSVFSDTPQELLDNLHDQCVLTPHEGEWERLFGPVKNREQDLRMKAGVYSSVLVLKGAETLIAQSDNIVVNRDAPPSLATGGSGDVLAGIIGGLMAQEMNPFYAASAGVWFHSEAARQFGSGLVASDLPEMLPHILTDFESRR